MAHSYRIKFPEGKLYKGASVKEITVYDVVNRGDRLKLLFFPGITWVVTEKIYEELDENENTYRIDLEMDIYEP